jgi:hypothetical protein
MNNWCICWFLRIFLLGILIFKGLTARRLYKSFGIKGFRNTWIKGECRTGNKSTVKIPTPGIQRRVSWWQSTNVLMYPAASIARLDASSTLVAARTSKLAKLCLASCKT